MVVNGERERVWERERGGEGVGKSEQIGLLKRKLLRPELNWSVRWVCFDMPLYKGQRVLASTLRADHPWLHWILGHLKGTWKMTYRVSIAVTLVSFCLAKCPACEHSAHCQLPQPVKSLESFRFPLNQPCLRMWTAAQRMWTQHPVSEKDFLWHCWQL